MLAWLKRSAVLRFAVAVLFAVPLTLMSAQTAQAAAAVDSAYKLSISVGGFADVNCTGMVTWGGHDTWNIYGGRCDAGLDTNPFYDEPGGPDTLFKVSLRGTGDEVCSASEGTFGEHPDNTRWTNVGLLEAFGVVQAGCVPEELCITIEHPGYAVAVTTGCSDINAPTTASLDCMDGQVTVQAPVKVGEPYIAPRGIADYNWVQDVRWNITATSGAWTAYLLMRPFPTQGANAVLTPQAGDPKPGNPLGWYREIYEPQTGVPYEAVQQVVVSEAWRRYGDVQEDPKAITGVVVGAGIYRDDYPQGFSWSAQRNLPSVHGSGMIGRSNVAYCSFYWGEKVYDAVGSNEDEPSGPLVTDGGSGGGGDVDEPEEEPDEANWWSALWAALKGIVSVLGKIAGAVLQLPGKILDGFLRLVIPDGNPFAEGIDDIVDSAADSEVGSWASAITGVFGGSEGGAGGPNGVGSGVASEGLNVPAPPASFHGCDGPEINIGRIIPDGMPSTLGKVYPFSSCSGKSAEMAHWSRLILTIVVSVGGGLKMLEMLLVSSGALKNTETLLAYDWSSARRYE